MNYINLNTLFACVLGVFLSIIVTSCGQTVPDMNENYLSTISGQVLSDCPDQPDKLCVINIGKGSSSNISHDLPRNIQSVAIAPNNQIHAYSGVDRTSEKSTIIIDNTSMGFDKKEIMINGFVSDLSWSADGSYLAFEVFNPNITDGYCGRSLFVQPYPTDNNNDLMLLAECIVDYTWSPLTNEIAYSSSVDLEDKGGTGLYKLNIEADDIFTLLKQTDGLIHMSIQWSPNGEAISYVEGIGPTESLGHLVVIDAFTAEELRKAVPQECSWLSSDRLCYAWSPDSTKVAFIKSSSTSRFSLEDLYILSVNNGDVEQITHTEDYAIDDNFDRLGIRLSYPLWLNESTIIFLWTQDNKFYLVATDIIEKDISLVTTYEESPRFYQAIP